MIGCDRDGGGLGEAGGGALPEFEASIDFPQRLLSAIGFFERLRCCFAWLPFSPPTDITLCLVLI